MYSHDHELADLPLAALADACRRERAHFLAHKASDPAYGLELFRRALTQPETGAAWPFLVEIYASFIQANINRIAPRIASKEDMVQEVWLKFWGSARSLHFDSLAAVLGYLKLTTVSVVMDEVKRGYRRAALETSFSDLRRADDDDDDAAQRTERLLGVGNADTVFNAVQRKRFRERCRELITDQTNYQVFYFRYSMGLPPRTIAATLAAKGILLFGKQPKSGSVSDLLDRMLDRLAADQEIRDLLHED